MTTLTAAPPRTTTRLATVGAALLAFGCVVLTFFDFFVTTSATGFHGTGDYLYTADGFPFTVGLLLLVAGVRAVNRGRDGRLGTIGFVITAVGSVAVLICLAASLVTRSENSLGPVYVLGSFATMLGVLVFAIGTIRARVLPWWIAVALAVTWVVGGLVGDNGPLGFKGSALLLAATAITMAVLVPRTASPAE